MAATGKLIHFLIPHLSKLQASIDQLNRLLVVLDRNYNEVFHEGLALFKRLSDLQFAIGRVEEIIDILHVDLHEGNADAPLFFALRLAEVV